MVSSLYPKCAAWSLAIAVLSLLAATVFTPAAVQAQSFTLTQLGNANVTSPTSIQWGPDGRLYVSQQDGTIQIFTVAEPTPGQFTVTAQESLNLIKQIPNHNDDGTLAPSEWQGTRQVTGIVLTSLAGDPSVPVLYVGSSDPRIGAGNGQSDLGLDTNSGIITKLTLDPVTNTWAVVDLVRGLPRSEENHSTNGLQLSADGQTMYVAQGGHTNAGAPSANFALTTEYALSAAVLSIDLAAIEALPTQTDTYGRAFKYDLPTLNDPQRSDVSSTPGFTDANDPFGGNDGLNQAKIDPTGPVQVYSPGWRNAYDLVVTQGGNMWVVDNGPNPGWGGHPLGESDYPSDLDGDLPGICTNDYDPLEPGSNSTGTGGDPAVNNEDNLHLVTQGYYGGHPTPVRGNAGAGLYVNDTWYQPGNPNLPVDWADVVPSANPVECDYRQPGVDDGALVTWFKKSVNGIAEYVSQGDLAGDLVLASLNDGTIYRVDLAIDGTTVLGSAPLASGLTAPLDLTVTGDTSPYPGVVWVATYGGGGSVDILIPDPNLICDGVDDNTIDDDGDGYTNADEIDNQKNPCSAADVPDNNDIVSEQAQIDAGQRTFLLSDLNDPDDDDDGVADLDDPFQVDPDNGTTLALPIFQDFFLGAINAKLAGGVGFTGLMVDGTRDYLTMYEPTNLLTGGATGQFSVINAGSGVPDAGTNALDNGFQFGFMPSAIPFVADVVMVPNYFNGTPDDGFEQGFYVGTGDQDSYVRVTLANESEFAALGSAGGIKVVYESAGVATVQRYPVVGLVSSSSALRLSLLVDPIAGTVQPQYQLGTGAVQVVGSPIALDGSLLSAVQGTHSLPGGVPMGLAQGTFVSTGGAVTSFQADFESMTVEEVPQTSVATLTVTPNGTINASTFTNGSMSVVNTSAGGEQISTMTIDLRGSVISDLVFDPDGTAGDTDFKAFTPNSGAAAVGYSSVQMLAPKNGVDGADGYQALEVTFTDFDPGETFTFSIDADPNSVKGTAGPGPGSSGSVSGLEMTGASVTFGFDNSIAQTARLFRGPGATTAGGGTATTQTGRPPAPAISMVGLNPPTTVTTASQTVRVTGPPGATVRLVQLDGALFEPSTGGYQVSPYDVNSAVAVNEQLVSLNATGAADVSVTLLKTVPESGHNVFVAAVESSTGEMSDPSSPVQVEFTPPTEPTAVERINTGGSGYITAAGDAFNADDFFSGGTAYEGNVTVSGTDDPALYQTERYGDFTYSFPVTNGTYSVNLHFAEIYWGVKKGTADPGKRVFDVLVEGQVALDNYDILANTSPATAIIETISGIDVSDGSLDVTFVTVANNAKVSAIEVLQDGFVIPPTTYALVTGTTGSGTVTRSPDQASYTDGTSVELAATPASGWQFDGWSGDATGTANPLTVPMDADKSITATFSEVVVVPEYVVTTSVVGSGTVTKTPDQATYTDGSTVDLTATAATGWYFTGWSGDATGTSNPLTLAVTADASVTATFAELPTAESFLSPLTVTDDAGKTVTRTFGAAPSATAGFDAGVDVSAPPAPPPTAFDARFTTGANPLYTDVRPSVTYPSSTTWQLAVQGTAPVTVTWDPALLPSGSLTMQTAGSTVNMKTQRRVTFSTLPETVSITFSPYDPATLASVTYPAASGWVLWGLSHDVGAVPYQTLLPLAVEGSLTGFAGQYETGVSPSLGRGMWVNFSTAGDQTFDGYPTSSVTVDLDEGWNLISGPSCSAPVPASITTAYAYASGAYSSTSTIDAYQGVWVLASAPGPVTLTCGSTPSLLASKGAVPEANATASRPAIDPVATITIRDAMGAQQTLFVTRPTDEGTAKAFWLPPVPPQGSFDARFATNSRLATETTSTVRVQGSAYPLTVRVDGDLGEAWIKGTSAGSEAGERRVRSGDTFQITDASVDAFSFELGEYALEELPAQFELKYNYPNPLRSRTAIVFDLPEEAAVTLEVYNVLGQRVMSAQYDDLAPRTDQEIVVDGSRLASGVYFYRVTARLSGRTVSDTGKMVVVQ